MRSHIPDLIEVVEEARTEQRERRKRGSAKRMTKGTRETTKTHGWVLLRDVWDFLRDPVLDGLEDLGRREKEESEQEATRRKSEEE